MNMIKILILLGFLMGSGLNLQAGILNNTSLRSDSLPYAEIGNLPGELTAANVIRRFIDGLGYRYYWATEGLRTEDLEFKAGEDSRTSLETLIHIQALTETILKFASNEEITSGDDLSPKSWPELRENTLNNIYSSSVKIGALSDAQLSEMQIVFRRGTRLSEFEFWYLLNGQISDAIYHVGQIVANRRASGNPLDANVNVFRGKNR